MNTKQKGGEKMDMMTRQKDVDEFVAREVYQCQTALVAEGLRQNIFSVDEIDNLYRPFDGKLIQPNVCLSCQTECLFLDSENGKCESCYDASNEPQDILEWWLISPWLGIKLKLEGEAILENEYGLWWGRTTSGQAIAVDFIINKIFEDINGYAS